MTETDHKGKAFFERAEQVAETGNWDFAIEMYIEGIKREPENVDRGHKALRDVSLKRKAQGGKGPSFKDQFSHRGSKDPVVNLANAEYLLAKEPGSVAHMQHVLKAAQTLDSKLVTKWACDILLDSQRAGKPTLPILLLLIQSYHDIEEYALALQACEIARNVSPDNPRINEAISELSAKYTLKKGKYGQEGDFKKGVKDMEGQIAQVQADSGLKDKRLMGKQVEKAREDYLKSPTVPGKVNGLVDALLKFEEDSYENEAIDVLKKAHTDLGAYQFKMRIGDIRIRQLTRKYREVVATGDKARAAQQAREQLEFELQEFAERTANYPTDLSLKYELGRRQFLAGRLDDAIAYLQQAQRDPRRHVAALSYLGQCFARKERLREACDTFNKAMESELSEERGKEIRYLLADVLERLGDLDKARDLFSEVAQMDYGYRDVRVRLDVVRKKQDEKRQGEEPHS